MINPIEPIVLTATDRSLLVFSKGIRLLRRILLCNDLPMIAPYVQDDYRKHIVTPM